jgi:hypothetical protein
VRDQGQLARLGNRRAMVEHSEILFLDGVQDFQAAAAEQIEVDGEFTVNLADERQSLPEPVAGALDFEFHHLAESRGVLIADDVVFGHAEAAQVFQRQIDAALGVVDTDILPEIRELQRGASEVRELLPFCVTVSAEIENQMADGVRRIVAIVENVVESFEPSDGLVLPERGQ